MIGDYRSKLSIFGIAKTVWRGKLLLAALCLGGAFLGLKLGKIQTPVYRIEYVVTRSSPDAIGTFREPFLKLLPLTVAPIYYPLLQKGSETTPEEGNFDFIAPTMDSIFEKYIYYARTLQGLEAAFADPRVVALARERGLGGGQFKALQSELLDRIRFVNLGINFERTRVVLVGEDIPLLEEIALSFFRHTSDLVARDVRKELEGRVRLIRNLIHYRMEYLGSLGHAEGAPLYGALVNAEKKLLETDLQHTQEALDSKFEPVIYTLGDGGVPNIVLLRPKPRLYAALCAVAGVLVGVWILLLVDILAGSPIVPALANKRGGALAEHGAAE